MLDKLFRKGLKSEFVEMAVKKDNVLYFCTDTREIYLGENLYSQGVHTFSGQLPVNPVGGVMYINDDNGTGYMYRLGSWHRLFSPVSTVIDDEASDDTTPTTKAVKVFVEAEVSDLLGGSSGGFSGFAKDIEYDKDNLTITIPMVGREPLVIDLPKDNFVKAGFHDSGSNELVFTLKDDSEIRIPISAIGGLHTSGSGANDTVKIVVDSVNAAISAVLMVDEQSGLGVDSNGKLTIDLSPYVTRSKIGEVGDITVKEYVDNTVGTAFSGFDTQIQSINEALTWGDFS